MNYGLIGTKLGHSYSKQIHTALGNNEYCLQELPMEKLQEFLTDADFKALNVTIPYKEMVMPFCEVDAVAKEIGSVNTVVNDSKTLRGYNTDYLGFLYLIDSTGIDFKGKNVVILGSGGTSKTVCYCAKLRKAQKITVLSRNSKREDEVDGISYLTYGDIHQCRNAEILINTTPVGMYPNNDDEVINLDDFKTLTALVDVIFNPCFTTLLLKAKKKGIKVANGLAMLVAQAWYADRYFFGKSLLLDEDGNKQIHSIYSSINEQKTNIALIGMPGAGKTTVGQRLAKEVRREFIDTDQRFEEMFGQTAEECILQYGETMFREKESEVLRDVSVRTGVVIATGGGSILNDKNVFRLQQNSFICFLNRPIEELATKGRPLSNTEGGVEKLYCERYPKYIAAADFTVDVVGSSEDVTATILNQFHQIQ